MGERCCGYGRRQGIGPGAGGGVRGAWEGTTVEGCVEGSGKRKLVMAGQGRMLNFWFRVSGISDMRGRS